MRYRIIKHTTSEGKTFYTIKKEGIFYWNDVVRHVFRGGRITMEFETEDAAKDYIKSCQHPSKEVVCEGEWP